MGTKKKNRIEYIALLFMLMPFASCDDNATTDIIELPTAGSVATDNDGNTYEAGFQQASSINQNPFVQKLDEDDHIIWQVIYEKSAVDGRANLVNIDTQNRPWVVFSVDGGSNEDSYITKEAVKVDAFNNVFASGYGSGGGPKVSILARLDPASGEIEKATFLTARLNNGKTNSLNIENIGFTDDHVLVQTKSAAWPPGEGTSYQRYPDITDEDRIDNAFFVDYEISYDLNTISKATIRRE